MARLTFQDPEKAARIIRDAGGKVIGRTRLQKMAYLLEVTDLGEGFSFQYRHYGPYSEQLTEAVSIGVVLGAISEEERTTAWGGSYSIFTSTAVPGPSAAAARKELIELAMIADPIALELAATAVFLATQGEAQPWIETARRKPEKAGRIQQAQDLYLKLQRISTPATLPRIKSSEASSR